MKAITYSAKLLKRHRAAILILLLFIVLAIIYSLVTPPFEAGDESRHYAVVKYMADTGRLPVQQPGEAQLHWSHEGNQPPLYYLLAAALTFWVDTGSWDDVYWYNPHTTIGNPLRADNKNITIHPPADDWPWRGHVLAVHLIRFFSIVLASVTVAAGYLIALSLFKGRRWPAAAAMAVTAFNPMFLFISASVNNDNLVITLVSLALLVMVRMSEAANQRINESANQRAREPGRQRGGGVTRQVVLLGLLIGLGGLSKLYALGLLPLAGLLLLWLAYRHGRFVRRALAWNLLLLLVVGLVAGWFYSRNALLYDGDLFALQVMRDTAGQRTETPSLATLRAEFEGFRIAYWALFGGVNVLADAWIYRVLDTVSLAAALGVVAFIAVIIIAGAKPPRGETEAPHMTPYALRFTFYSHAVHSISLPTFLILFGWYLTMVAGFIIWNLTQPAGQGRLLYPAITAISSLGMLGLTWWLPRRWQRIVSGLCGLALFIFAALSPGLYIAPVYARPALLAEANLPAGIQPVDFVYEDKLRLIGYQLPESTVRPAESLPLTLYWHLLKPAGLDYSIYIHLLGRQRQVAGQLDTYPGQGQWPTTLLSPGNVLVDHYEVPIRPETEAQAPTQLLVAVGIYDYNEPGRPGRPAANAAGQLVEPIIARARLVPWQWPDPPRLAQPVNFLDPAGQPLITLLSYELAGEQDSLTLNWQANSAIQVDYTVFIQAWSLNSQARTSQGGYAAGFDGPPRQGDYPTSLWQPGDIIVDTHPLELSTLTPGSYELLVGLYDPVTGGRLPAFVSGEPLPDYALNAGTLQVGQ